MKRLPKIGKFWAGAVRGLAPECVFGDLQMNWKCG